AGGFASNGYGTLSPGGYSMGSCFLAELLLTFFFLMIIIGTTSKGAATGFAGIPIGLALTLIHLVSIPGIHPVSTLDGFRRLRLSCRVAFASSRAGVLPVG
ncbi:MAG: hypothetical protein ACRYGM_25145, partial [Janthinobacterium lividum]